MKSVSDWDRQVSRACCVVRNFLWLNDASGAEEAMWQVAECLVNREVAKQYAAFDEAMKVLNLKP
jgi:hypothetical protein